MLSIFSRCNGRGQSSLLLAVATFALTFAHVFGNAADVSEENLFEDSSRLLAEKADDGHGDGHGDDHHGHPHYAIIFPVFILMLGVVVHWVLGRVCHHVFPYTAAMFGIGIFLGALLEKFPDNQLTTSIDMWSNIDGHVLLMVFLPGLLFKDAFSLDVHLFRKAFAQCATMAFPEVLAGTSLTALVLAYVFPYFTQGWGALGADSDIFIWCLVLGSVLAATDPVAVSALLNEVGAPPRLKTHIAGESLLNDGAAIVFFNIFYKMDLYNFSGGARGQLFTWGSGIAYFFKLSLGSAALGVALGIVLVGFLYLLNHRYNYEENVVQVMMTVGMAYFSFYLGESIFGISGVICVVFCGIITKAYGDSIINDHVAMHKFWDLTEHILNTVLFATGGVVWGTVIVSARDDGIPDEYAIGGREWGYLILLYLFVLLIRAFLILVFYPIISNIGLKTTWQESLFMSWGGLRGAVGIALGIVIENEWKNVSAEDVTLLFPDAESMGTLLVYRGLARLWFFFAGGISLLTLVINGTTAGPLLKKLGLANTTEIRKDIVQRYWSTMVYNVFGNLITLLRDDEYSVVQYGAVVRHVPFLKDITLAQFNSVVRCSQFSNPSNLSTFKSFFPEADCFAEGIEASPDTVLPERTLVRQSSKKPEVEDPVAKEEAIEMRKVFVSLLEKSYENQVEKGYVDARYGFLVINITSSMQKAKDDVAQGKPINDGEDFIEPSTVAEQMVNQGRRASYALRKRASQASMKEVSNSAEYKKADKDIVRALACIQAHKDAQEAFRVEFCNSETMSSVEAIVLDESDAMIRSAQEVIKSKNQADVKSIVTRFVCLVLLNEMVHLVGSYVDRGLLNSTEAEHLIHPIEHHMKMLHKCDGSLNYGEADAGEKETGSNLSLGSS